MVLVISLTLINQTACKPVDRDEDSPHSNLSYRIQTKSDEIVWLLNQLIDILSEMVSGLELDPSLLHNYHFRQILVHMIQRIDYILEHFENMGQLPGDIKNALHRLDCVRIRLSNYINKKSGQQLDDTVCYETGMGSTRSPMTTAVAGGGGGEQTNQIMVIMTQIVYIIVQIVNKMGPTGDGSPHKQKTTTGDQQMTTPFDWDQMVSQYSTPGPLTNTPNWNDLISQIMDQMGSTLASAGASVDMGITSAPIDPTTVDWGELISAVVGEIERQYGTTPSSIAQTSNSGQNSGNRDYNTMVSAMDWGSAMGRTTTRRTSNTQAWDPWANIMGGMFSSTPSPWNGGSMGKTTVVFDVQSCIDSIMSIVTDITNQLPDNNRGMATPPPPMDTTQDLSDIMSGILGQFG